MSTDNSNAGGGNASRGLLKAPQDFAAGLFLITFALIAFFGAWDLKFGKLSGIGPGLMPRVTAFIVGTFGLLLVVQALITRGDQLERWAIRGPVFVLAAVVVFALTVRTAGLIVAGPLAVIVSALADKGSRPLEIVIFAVALTTLCGLMFKDILNLPIPFDPLGLVPDFVASAYFAFKKTLIGGVLALFRR